MMLLAYKMPMAQDTYHSRVILGMSPELVAAIDDFRFTKRRRSRAEAMRELLVDGLIAHGHLPAVTPANRPEKMEAVTDV